MARLDRASWISTTIILLLSALFILYNQTVTHYQGIRYFPALGVVILMTTLGLIIVGLRLLLDERWTSLISIINRLGIVFMLLSLIAINTYAVQLTPFPTIDLTLIKVDHWLGIDVGQAMNFAYQHPPVADILKWLYTYLDYQLSGCLLLMTLFYDEKSQRQFIFLLISSCLIGFTIYYFFPTTAPSTVVENPHFMQVQRSTFLKFYQIHQHIPATTVAGGLIALPSFHAIWAIICQHYLFRWFWVGVFTVPLNILVLFSCVMLGWHYVSDIIASFIVCLPLIWWSNKYNDLK